jgi:hypothetical protein
MCDKKPPEGTGVLIDVPTTLCATKAILEYVKKHY